MPRAYPREFRARAVALVRAGKQQKQTAEELGIHPVTLANWVLRTGLTEGRSTASRPANPQSCGQRAVASESSRQSS